MSPNLGLRIKGLTTVRGGKPVDIQVGPGECLFLSGPSGVGKSLLLRAIADLDPHEGEIHLNGVEYREIAGPAWRRRMGLLTTDSPWWLPQVADHFPAGSLPAPLLAELDLPEEALAWPIVRLSSGERQRLALIRLLLHQPMALLLDEPTANLDDRTARQVEEMVMSYRQRQQIPLIWVSHQTEQIHRLGGRLLQMTVDGGVVEVRL
jgi:ABC-type iron transport system FetAB ATPase subunit